ncbi:hypothetical protein Hanom_Chr07g00609021 [Helianthus anomalus]
MSGATHAELFRPLSPSWPPTPPLPRGTGFDSWEWHMSPRVKTRHGKVTAELAWSGSGSRSEITPTIGRTVHYPPLLT